MKAVVFISPCIMIAPDCGGSGGCDTKKKCCKKYKKKGKTNCRRCPKL